VSYGQWLIATITGAPQDLTFLRRRDSFYEPISMPSTWLDRTSPGLLTSSIVNTPKYLIYRRVSTSLIALNSNPSADHAIFTNFTAPRSVPKPDSVTTVSARSRAVLVAITEFAPCAMLANGPP